MHFVFSIYYQDVWAAGALNHEIQKSMESLDANMICLFLCRSVPVANIAQSTFMRFYNSELSLSILLPSCQYRLLHPDSFFHLFLFSVLGSIFPRHFPSVPLPHSSVMCHPYIWHPIILSPAMDFTSLTLSSIFFSFSSPLVSCPSSPFLLSLFPLLSTFTLFFCQVSHPLP